MDFHIDNKWLIVGLILIVYIVARCQSDQQFYDQLTQTTGFRHNESIPERDDSHDDLSGMKNDSDEDINFLQV